MEELLLGERDRLLRTEAQSEERGREMGVGGDREAERERNRERERLEVGEAYLLKGNIRVCTEGALSDCSPRAGQYRCLNTTNTVDCCKCDFSYAVYECSHSK